MKTQFAKLVFLQDGKIINEVVCYSDESKKYLIGKDASCTIVLTSSFVSKNHAEILIEHPNILVKDLNSTNGTYINNNRISSDKPYQAKIGDVITFSKDTSMQLVIAEPEVKEKSNFETVISTNPPFSASTIINELKEKTTIWIGRDKECKIFLDNPTVSRHHAKVEKLPNGKYLLTDLSVNGTYVNGKLVSLEEITDKDVIKICGFSFTLSDKIGDFHKSEVKIASIAEKLKNKNSIIVGRQEGIDIYINDPQVSRQHAEITKESDGVYIKDLGSTNGTYLNGKLIKGKVKFTEFDTIHIGLHAFKLNEAGRNLEESSTAIRAVNVEKTYPNGYIGLKKMNVNIPHKAFVALMGPSGCGKTTFMNTLNGDNPATKGNVYIHGLELTQNYSLLKRKIGYVPQQDIVHNDLTVESSLYFAAKLRMPDDTSEEEIKERINEVLTSLKINIPKIRETKVGELSGGQRKRVSIAVELLNNPTILFLDEPTSPLDPETIEEFLSCIKGLTEKGTTVVMVTHKPEDLNYVDRVIFLATFGYHVFFGTKDELLKYFSAKSIINVYSELSFKESKEKTEQRVKNLYDKWYKEQEQHETKENPGAIKKDRDESLLRQFYWLTRRYFNIKLNDKVNMILLMAQPLIISGLLIFIFEKLQLGVLFLMAISAIWFGVSNAAKEIVSELPIYKRERMFNLNIFTYLSSKMTVLSVIALIQVFLFVTLVYFRYNGDPEVQMVHYSQYLFFMFYLAFSASLMGLLLSAIFDNTEKVMTVVPIALMPQIMLAGVVTRIDNLGKELLSYLTFGRWGTEGFARIQDNHTGFNMTDTLLYNKQIDTLFKDTIFAANTPFEKKMHMISGFKTHFTETARTISKSVYNSVPKITDDTLIIKVSQNRIDTVPYTMSELSYQRTNALDQLGFYDYNLHKNGSLICMCQESKMTCIVLFITALNVVMFVSLYIALKKKDRL